MGDSGGGGSKGCAWGVRLGVLVGGGGECLHCGEEKIMYSVISITTTSEVHDCNEPLHTYAEIFLGASARSASLKSNGRRPD